MGVMTMEVGSILAYLVSNFPHTSERIIQWMTFLSDKSLQNNVDKGSLLVRCLLMLVVVMNDYFYFVDERHEGGVPEHHSWERWITFGRDSHGRNY